MDVRLEPMSDVHLAGIEALVADPEVLRFTRVPTPVPEGFAQRWIDRYAASREAGAQEGFAALGADGTFLGLALVPELDRAGRQAELGYIVAAGQRGRGAGT